MKDKHRLQWLTKERTKVYDGPIFDLNVVSREASDGRVGKFIEIDAPQWATIIPWMRNAEGIPSFVMVRQYRHGSDSITIEFPAGVVEHGELPLDAAVRELLEETGYQPEVEVIELGSISPNPAFMNNRVSFFFAEGVKKVGEQTLDVNEQLDVLLLPVETVIESMGTGAFDNGIMMIAQAYFLRYARFRKELFI